MSKRIGFSGMFVVVLVALGATGCGKKADDCNAVIDVYNKGLAANRAVKDDDPEGTSKLSAVWTSIAGDLGKLQLSTDGLKPIVGKLQSAAHSAGEALSEVGKTEGAAAKVQPAVESYGSASKELQTFCGVEEKK